ncbi:MAG: Wzy polymerase domain-containing protein [Burkholderiales bacterium]
MKIGDIPAIGLLLAGSLCLLPFLVPYHQEPFLSFFPEWLAAALGISAAAVVLAGDRATSARLPTPGLWLLAFAAFLTVQAAFGGRPYPQLSLLGALYVLYAVLMIWVGAQLAAEFGVERVATVLAAFLLAGALANAVAGSIQFHGRPALLQEIVAELRGGRPYGNIAQANLYADYLALGEGALLFLWLRGRVRSIFALAGLALLVVGSALTSSRSVVLYALSYAALAFFTVRAHDPVETRRLRFAACFLAGAALAAYFAVPWANSAFHSGPHFDRPLAMPGEYAEPRIGAFVLGLGSFVSAPLLGTGIGGFAGSAYERGLDASLTRFGEVWTSPHNLALHLLAETGLVGTLLGLGGLFAWGAQIVRRYRAEPQLELWWLAAAVGIVLIHSAIEFPLWSAHFLGVTALLIGASASSKPALESSAGRIGAAAICIVLTVTLGLLLRDYMRLDVTRITGTTVTLAPAAQTQSDAATMRELTRGFLAPLAERWIVLGTPLDKVDLADKLAVSERVSRSWPAGAIIVRRAVFLAFDDRAAEARTALARALRAFPQRREATILILRQALPADPEAIGPLLALAQAGAPR